MGAVGDYSVFFVYFVVPFRQVYQWLLSAAPKTRATSPMYAST
jgi:hypothetical protein